MLAEKAPMVNATRVIVNIVFEKTVYVLHTASKVPLVSPLVYVKLTRNLSIYLLK